MPAISTEVYAVYRGKEDLFNIVQGQTYHLKVVFIRQLRTVLVFRKERESDLPDFTYSSWQYFTESWEITEVLR